MKLSVNKILYHWYGKVQPNYKYHAFQVSWMPDFRPEIELDLSLRRSFGNITPVNIRVLGLLSLRIYHTRDEDHAGLYFNLNLLGLDIDYNYIDVRHYDHDNEKWEECNIEEINKHYKR
jgi:hypothetical protein